MIAYSAEIYIESVNTVFFFCIIKPSESLIFIIIMYHLELTPKSYEDKDFRTKFSEKGFH
jgi:hypothetical protein